MSFLVQGMLGLGDNLHQRAVIREFMRRGAEVWLSTPWPSVYVDLVEKGLRLAPPQANVKLRTQQANTAREHGRYHRREPFAARAQHSIWYTHAGIRQYGGFLAAMCAASGVPKGDFSFPVPAAWLDKASAWLRQQGAGSRPLMLYRPLVERTEWPGCRQRNPDPAAYVALARAVRDRFFVVSVADLVDGKEWQTSEPIGADVECHRGELKFEMLAALAALSGLVFCSPGFALVLAQAVGAPLAAVFGGHESGRLYTHGNPRDLMIEPIRPCECFDKSHPCRKEINLERATAALLAHCEARTEGARLCA